MSGYHLEKIKANSSVKSDIEAIIQDRLISQSRPVDFSIKSRVGGALTLLNASRRASFVYRVHNFNGGLSEVNNIGGSRKMRDRLRAIAEADGVLEFSHVKDAVFAQNMRIIDTAMPDLLANMLIDYYSGQGATMMQLCASSGAKGLYGLGVAETSYKVESFLRAIALGLASSRKWDTRLSTYGGYIIVRDDGMLLCYHLYNDDDFRDYLFNNTKLDTPSTSRHDFGYLYEQNEDIYIKLNLQVGFC